MTLIEYFLLVFLFGAALSALFSRENLTSIISLSIFSTISAVLYLLYRAPDVALAQIVIGAGLYTAIFISAISQIRTDRQKNRPEDPLQ
ncbi:MAG: energy-converting hydrogenase subunit [Candidatus Atribacteria bacterium]|nr:energy-converting hydrogenase subunit [Candidatus Atribacteria bacterium]